MERGNVEPTQTTASNFSQPEYHSGQDVDSGGIHSMEAIMGKRKKLTKNQRRNAKVRGEKRKEATRRHAINRLFNVEQREARRRNITRDVFLSRFEAMWFPDKIEPMDTSEIIERLHGFGIEYDEEEFIRAASSHYSSSDLAHALWDDEMNRIEGYDGDFPWVAAGVLWLRVCPNTLNNQMILDMMDEGYDYLNAEDTIENRRRACDVWLELWHDLEPKFLADCASFEMLDGRISDECSCEMWLADLLATLHPLAKSDHTYKEQLNRLEASVRQHAHFAIPLLEEESTWRQSA